MVRKVIICLLLGVSAIAGEVIRPDYDGYEYPAGWIPRKSLHHPKLGLALSGGGLRGLAHVGVLRALEEADIEVDYIAGVSMGAVVGALYASGYTTDELERIFTNTDWGDLLIDQPSRRSLFLTRKRTHGRHILQVRFREWKPYFPSGLTSGQKTGFLIDDLLMNGIYRGSVSFDSLKVSFRAPTTDLFTGELILFDAGDLGEVLRASMAFPLVFSPIEVAEHTLIDGGALENIPVSTVRKMGADRVIAVDTASPLLPNVDEPWEIANQVTTIMIAEKMDQALKEADIALSPVPDSVSSFDFSSVDAIPQMGYELAMQRMDDIKKLLENVNQERDRALYVRDIKWNIPAEVSLSEADIDTLSPPDTLYVSELKQYMARLYEKYELEDIYAEVSGGTIIFNVIPTVSFENVYILGNELVPDSALKNAIKSPSGKPISYRLGVRDRENILRIYRDYGYSLAEITKVELKGGDLYIYIDEGRISSLEVEGGRHSALNDLGLKPGQVFNWRIAKQGLNRLYGTDIYKTVRLSISKASSGNEVKLMLERRPFPLVRLGARYDTERGGNGLVEFIYEDVLGSGTSVNLVAVPGELDSRVSGFVSADRILGSYLIFNAGAVLSRAEFPSYDIKHRRQPGYGYNQSMVSVSVGHHLFRWGMLLASLKYERMLSDHPDDVGEQSFTSVVLETAIDTYDRYPFPRSGQTIRICFQSTGDFLPGEAQFNKIYGDIERWLYLKHRWSLYLRLRGGYAEPTVPTYEKFSLGGLDDFSGLHQRETLGNQLFAGRIALRFDLLSRFLAEAFLSVRYDFAQIVDGTDVLEFRKGFFRQGLGASFALNTLIGPVELAWGWAAPYKNIPQKHLLYFSIGHSF